MMAGDNLESDAKETECDPDSLDSEGNGTVRRPMNAFLIFCKRHRSLVREKFPNMENRNITKILGEWWANLEAEEKLSYTDLAKQYKEAFMRANPDFRWYKLPAPSSRTLVTRPSNQRLLKLESTTTNACNFSNVNKCGITPGKLADETQLGGLNSLISKPTSSVLSKPPKKRYLQNGAFVNSDEVTTMTTSHSDPQTTNACSALLELATMCSLADGLETTKPQKQLQNNEDDEKTNSVRENTAIPNNKNESVVPDGFSESKTEFDNVLENANRDPFNEKETTVSHQQLINCIIENSIGNTHDDDLFDGSAEGGESGGSSCRKSQRKGRGNRYRALLSQGILQPPKDRRNAMMRRMEDGIKGGSGDRQKIKCKGVVMRKGEHQMTAGKSKSLNFDAQINALSQCNFDASIISRIKKQKSEDANNERSADDDADSLDDPDLKMSSGMLRLLQRQNDDDDDDDDDDGDEDSSSFLENDFKNRFQTGDFDLEKQIAALPSLNIDLLNRRKKKQRRYSSSSSGSLHNSVSSMVAGNEHKMNNGDRGPRNGSVRLEGTTVSCNLVGSQKRKARKRSITHLDPSSDHKPHTSVVESRVLDTFVLSAGPPAK